MGDAARRVFGDRQAARAHLRSRGREACQTLRRGAVDGARHRVDSRSGIHGAGLQTGPGRRAAGAFPIDREATGAPVGTLEVGGWAPKGGGGGGGGGVFPSAPKPPGPLGGGGKRGAPQKSPPKKGFFFF